MRVCPVEGITECLNHQIRMFVLIWATLLFSVRGIDAETDPSLQRGDCADRFCITLSEGEITAEAGLCVVIPCSFTTSYSFRPQNIVWYKCESNDRRCRDSNIMFLNDRKVHSGRVSQLEPDVSQNNCSIIINDVTKSDSGSYQPRVDGYQYWDSFRFSPRVTVSVKDLIQKPSVMIPPLTEGKQTTLTCTAPGLCSGSEPKITWMWRGAGEKDSHITGNTTDFKTEYLTAVTQRHSSTLRFNLSAEHHGTEVTCKVSFTNGITTEETVTLNVTLADQHGSSAVLPWVIVAVASLIMNIICIILLMLLWSTRKKVKSNQEDRTYMSLQKTDPSPAYDVIAPRLI